MCHTEPPHSCHVCPVCHTHSLPPTSYTAPLPRSRHTKSLTHLCVTQVCPPHRMPSSPCVTELLSSCVVENAARSRHTQALPVSAAPSPCSPGPSSALHPTESLPHCVSRSPCHTHVSHSALSSLVRLMSHQAPHPGVTLSHTLSPVSHRAPP